jgi:energy-coupling factor transporter ATP-binding protein EcfA2
MLARVQTVDCGILILDEPCSFLDNRVKETFLAALRQTVSNRGLLALLVTHVWEEARLVADDVIFFHRPAAGPVSPMVSQVDRFVRIPPSIDAMYAIHWPHCTLLERKDVANLIGEKKAPIPDGTQFVGLFSAAAEGTSTELARMISRRFAESGGLRHQAIPNAPNLPRIRDLNQCVFFGVDGVTLATPGR